MSQSTNLALPYLGASQSQKHLTVNEGLRFLDVVVQIAAKSAALSAPPGIQHKCSVAVEISNKARTETSGSILLQLGHRSPCGAVKPWQRTLDHPTDVEDPGIVIGPRDHLYPARKTVPGYPSGNRQDRQSRQHVEG